MRAATVIAFVVSLVIQVGFPLGISIAFRRSARAPWRVFFYGALTFCIFQLFTWLPLSTYLDVVVGEHLGSELQAFIYMLGMALIGSLVEELGRLWGYRFLFGLRGDRWTWRNGVMYGLGSAAVETMLLIAGLTFVYFLLYLALTVLGQQAFLGPPGVEASPELQKALAEVLNTTWVQPVIVAFERILALPHQVAWALLVMQSVTYRQKRWFGFAVLYHASIAIIVPGLLRLSGYAAAEAANAGFALLSLWIIFSLRVASLEERR